MNSRREADRQTRVTELRDGVSDRMSMKLITAIFSVGSVQSFVVAKAPSAVPNISDLTVNRINGFDVNGFDTVAAAVYADPGLVSNIFLFPGGMRSQAYPENSFFPRGFDIFNISSQKQSMERTVVTGEILIEAPRSLIDAALGFVVRIPVYINTSVTGFSTWWGNVVGMITFEDYVNSILLDDGTIAGSQWVVAMFCVNSSSGSGVASFVVVVDERLSRGISSEQQATAFALGKAAMTSTAVLSANATIIVYYWNYGDADAVEVDILRSFDMLPVILGPMMLAVVIAVACNVLYALMSRKYESCDHAPKRPPFAMLLIGIARSEEWWIQQPEAFADALKQVSQRLDREIEHHKAYSIRSPVPHAFAVVGRSVDAAIHIAFAMIESLERKPIEMSLVPRGRGRKQSREGSTHSTPKGDAQPIEVQTKLDRSKSDISVSISNALAVADLHGSERLANGTPRDENTSVSAPSGGVMRRITTKVPLHLVCCVHWCLEADVAGNLEELDSLGSDDPFAATEDTAASVQASSSKQTLVYTYEGKSPLFAGKIFQTAMLRSVGSQVWLSQETAALVESHMRDVTVTSLGIHQIPRVPAPQEVFSAMDPSSSLMLKAAKSAMYAHHCHLERIRETVISPSSSVTKRTAHVSNVASPSFKLSDALGAAGAGEAASSNSDHAAEDTPAAQLVAPQVEGTLTSQPTAAVDAQFLVPTVIPQVLRSVFEEIFDPLIDTYPQYDFTDLVFLFFHFHQAYYVMLKPLGQSERDNILRKLAYLHGISQQNLLAHLAVFCTLQALGGSYGTTGTSASLGLPASSMASSSSGGANDNDGDSASNSAGTSLFRAMQS